MTYDPNAGGGMPNLETSEELSGRTVDGEVTYVQLVKITGFISSGATNNAHGISGIARIVDARAIADKETDTFYTPLPFSSDTLNRNIELQASPTNVFVRIGSAWNSTPNRIQDVYIYLEYTKT